MKRRITALSVGLAAAVLMVAIALASPAYAALGLSERADRTWMTNGNVYAQALSADGETLYIGGKFNRVRETPAGTPGGAIAVNNLAAIDVATGAPVRGWRPAVTGDGSTSPVVRALEVRGGTVYVGGRFSAVGGQPRRNLAAVDDATGAVSASFDPVVGDATSLVYGLESDASRLYIGGTFSRVDGMRRGNLAAVDPSSGALATGWTARANGAVRKLELDSSGATVFAVGAFSSVSSADGAAARQSVARFEAATGDVHPWAPAPGAIDTDASRGGKMTCWTVTVTPARLYVGCGLGPNYAASLRLDAGNTGTRVWRFGLVGNPVSSTLSPDGSRLILGGHFGINPLDQRVCGGRLLKGLVALDPIAAESVGAANAVDCSWIPSLDQKSRPDYDGAWDLTASDDHLWVAGGFTGVSGVPQTNLARFTYSPTLP